MAMATGVKVSSLTIDESPTLSDWLYLVDLTATPASRRVRLGDMLSLITSGVSAPYLAADTIVGATDATVVGLPTWAATDLFWGVFDPGSVECEVRKLEVSGDTVSWADGLTYAHDNGDPVLILSEPIFNVKYWGATGDGSTDDRLAVQAAIDEADEIGSGTVLLPPGIYDSTRGAGNFIYDLRGKSNIRIQGSGIDQTIIRWRPNIAWNGDTHTLWLRDANNIEISDLTIDGSFGVGTTTFDSEQKHGIRVEAILADLTGIRIERVKFWRLRGDGVYLLGDAAFWSQQIWLLNNQFINNGRSGFVLNGVRNLFAIANYFSGQSDQWLDCEGTKVKDIFVAFNKSDNAAGDVTAVQFSGSSAVAPQENIDFLYNTFDGGGIFMSSIINSRFIGNTVTGAASPDHRPIDGRGRIENVLIEQNTFNHLGTEQALSFLAETGQGATSLTIRDNIINLYGDATVIPPPADPIAIQIQRGTKCIVKENRIYRPGAGSWTGIAFLAASAGVDVCDDIAIEENRFYNLATAIILTVRNGNKVDGLSLEQNRFYDCVTALHINSPAYDPLVAGSDFYYGSSTYSGVTTKFNNESTITHWKVGEGEFNGTGSPEGVVTAPVGDKYWRLDGGAGQWLYKKATGTGNTGWVGVA